MPLNWSDLEEIKKAVRESAPPPSSGPIDLEAYYARSKIIGRIVIVLIITIVFLLWFFSSPQAEQGQPITDTDHIPPPAAPQHFGK